MAVAEIVATVGGVEYLLGDIAHTSGAKWSTAWPGGCESASVELDVSPVAQPAAISLGADFAVWDGPARVWAGYTSEFEPATSDSPARLHAKGYYSLAAHFLALAADGLTPTATPSTAVSQARARGWPIEIGSNLSSVPFAAGEQTVELNTVASLLEAWATTQGFRWRIDRNRTLWTTADPTTPRWFLNNAEPLRGVADDDYATNLYGRYVSAVDTNGDPSAWSTVKAGGNPVGTRRREQGIDLRDLGYYSTATTPQAITNAELGLIGSRYGYTNSMSPQVGELLTEGGVPVRLGHVRAGEMFRAFNVADPTGRVQVGLSADVVIGRTEYEDGADTVTLTPVDLAPRTFGEIQRAEKTRRDAEAEKFKGDAA